MVRFPLALLLLATAVLKLHGLAVDPAGSGGLFSAPEFQLAVIELEIPLALWLLWGKQPLGCWMVSLIVFASFAVASLYLGLAGQASCGCGGALLKINPFYACIADTIIVAALLLASPDLTPLWENPRRNLTAAAWPASGAGAGIVLCSSLLFGLAYGTFGSVPAALAYFRGESVSVRPRLVDVGAGLSGDIRETTFELTNWTDEPVLLFGGTKDCACTVLSDLPLTIPAHETRAISIRVRLTGAPGIFSRKAGVVVDDAGFKRIDFGITGRITGPATGGD